MSKMKDSILDEEPKGFSKFQIEQLEKKYIKPILQIKRDFDNRATESRLAHNVEVFGNWRGRE